MKDIESIEDLTLDPENPNEGTEFGRAVIEQSLSRLGAGRGPVTDRNGKVIAGNKTIEVARELGLDIEVIHTDGRRLVVIVRDDLDLDTDARARELSIADNRASEVGLAWRGRLLDQFRMQFRGLKLDYMFGAEELRSMIAGKITEKAATNTGGKAVTCPKCGEQFRT